MQRGAEGSRSLRMATQHYYERVPQEHAAWAQSRGRATEPRHPQGEERAPLRCVALRSRVCVWCTPPREASRCPLARFPGWYPSSGPIQADNLRP